AFLARDDELAFVPLQRVLDDRQSQAGAAARPRAAGVDAVEALRHARNLLLGYADAGVDDLENGGAVDRAPDDFHATARRRETHGVVHEVVEDRMQLGLFAEQRSIRFERELDARAHSTLELLHERLQHA